MVCGADLRVQQRRCSWRRLRAVAFGLAAYLLVFQEPSLPLSCRPSWRPSPKISRITYTTLPVKSLTVTPAMAQISGTVPPLKREGLRRGGDSAKR